MRTLLDSPEFVSAGVERTGDEFTAPGDGFGVTINTRDGLIAQIDLSAAGDGGASQLILVTYGTTPEARKLFDSAH